jgi:hypothetical protein
MLGYRMSPSSALNEENKILPLALVLISVRTFTNHYLIRSMYLEFTNSMLYYSYLTNICELLLYKDIFSNFYVKYDKASQRMLPFLVTSKSDKSQLLLWQHTNRLNDVCFALRMKKQTTKVTVEWRVNFKAARHMTNTWLLICEPDLFASVLVRRI